MSKEMKVAIAGAVVAGLFTVAAAFIGKAWSSHTASYPPGPDPTSQQTSPVSSPVTTQSQPTSSEIQWQGSVTIGSSGVNLDALPQNTSAGATFQMESGFNGSGMSLAGGGPSGSWAIWQGSSAPTYQQCHSALFTDDPASVISGLKICVVTGDGHGAHVGFTNVQGATAKADVIVWNH